MRIFYNSLVWAHFLLCLAFFSFFTKAFAEPGPSPTPGGTPGPAPTPGEGGGISLTNPLKSDDLTSLLQSILSVIMVFAVPLIVFMIIYAGFLYVTAQGNVETVKKAHRALLYAVIGGVIILGAQVILAVIKGTVESF